MKKLSNYLKLSYGLADTFFILMVSFSNMYILVFFTEVLKISPVTAGLILMIGRIIDTVSVPVLGPIIEKSNPKWGRYRAWVFVGSFFICIFTTLLFVDFTVLPQGAMIVIATIVYAVFCISTNASYIGYTSLNSSVTDDPKERVQLSTVRGQGNAIGKIIGGWLYVPMLYMFAGTHAFTKQGFLLTGLFLGILTIVGYGNLFYATKDYKYAGVNTGKDAPKVSVKDMLKQIVSSRPLIMLLIADIARILTTLMISAMFPYFYIHVVKDPEMQSVFFGMTAILMLIGSTIVPLLTKKLTKKQTYILGNLWLTICLFAMFFLSDNATLVLIFGCLGYIGVAFSNVVNTAMYADITDYGHYKTGKNARAAIFSVYQLSIKIAAVFSTSVSAFGLALIGFTPGVAPTPEVITGIKYLAMFLPAFLALIGCIALLFYNIDEKKIPEMREAVKQREMQNKDETVAA